jgi:two-component system CheB/CheR fusion protein
VSETGSEQQFTNLLDYLNRSRGFDFTGYKRASLMRRIEKRMQTVGISGYDTYEDYLEVHPDEFAHLFNMILINVTAFFRDSVTWDYVAQEVVPRLLAAKPAGEPIRVWSAGCASGEEVYTLAMIFAEALGTDAFRERLKLYATDIDEEALAQARLGSYSARDVSTVPEPLRERYFEQSANRHAFNKDLRRAMIFGRHDLLKDAPISRIDLLVCRNALMYFNAEMQTQVLQRMHFALNDTGVLFLGKAEMLFTHGNLFSPLDLKRRVFVKVLKGAARERLASSVTPATNGGPQHAPDNGPLRDMTFDTGPIPQIVVDFAGTLAFANERARVLFRLVPRDVGRMLQDLEISYRPLELRAPIDQVYTERRTVDVKDVVWPNGPGESLFLDVRFQPLINGSGALLGVSVTFTDVSRYRRLQQALEETNHELEAAYEELQSTNEELETTNEELQSTVEELETTNEELQSTNEELETMNEEMQSTNEELQTVNEELQTRGGELGMANSFLNSVLASMRSGVAVVDRDLEIQTWNHKAEDMWGLRADEVRGKHLLNLDIGLPAEELKIPIRACLSSAATHEEVVVDATNRRGRAIRCRVTCTPLANGSGDPIGAILLMDEV